MRKLIQLAFNRPTAAEDRKLRVALARAEAEAVYLRDLI